jgi:hypothetical protein
MEFSVWGYVRDKVFFHLFLEEQWARITVAVATIDADMIHRILDEIYSRHICRVTRETHSTHVNVCR